MNQTIVCETSSIVSGSDFKECCLFYLMTFSILFTFSPSECCNFLGLSNFWGVKILIPQIGESLGRRLERRENVNLERDKKNREGT